MNAITKLNQALTRRDFFKAIAGIDNFDLHKVLDLVVSAERGGAHAVDIACDVELLKAVKAKTNLIVFVSSLDAEKLIEAAKFGADVLEIGNFDALYKQGLKPEAKDILETVRMIRRVVLDTPICVTIPGFLSIEEQLDLATLVQAAGADLLQLEGLVGKLDVVDTKSAIDSITEALANTREIRKTVEMPIIVAGGLNWVNVPFAIAAGADGVGIGKAITRLDSVELMTDVVFKINKSLESLRFAGFALPTV